MVALFITNTIGLISSLICVLLFFFIAYQNPKFMNRITLRLQVALSVVDLVAHILLYLHEGQYSKRACSLMGFLLVYQNSVYITIVLFVTLILHLNFLSTKKFNVRYEKFIWGAIVIIPLIHNIPPYVLDMFGLDNNGFCFIDMKKPNNDILLFTNLIIPVTIVFIYSLVITIIILYKVKTDCTLTSRVISTHRHNDPNSRRLLQKLLQSWILRLIMYPAAFCLMDSGIVIDFFLQIVFNHSNPVLYYWAAVGGRLSGLFNLIAFLLDPYSQYAFKTMLHAFKQMDTKYPSQLTSTTNNSSSYCHEVKMVDITHSSTSDLMNNNLEGTEKLNEDEAVALLQNCISHC